MFPQKTLIKSVVDSETYPLGEPGELSADGRAMALVALSHTPLEHRIYLTMLSEASASGSVAGLFNTRRLMSLTNIRSSGTVRRGLEGLLTKLSIERLASGEGSNNGSSKHFSVRGPEDILARRQAMGVEMYPHEGRIREGNQFFERAIRRVVANNMLSRREAQVALCCVEGLTNADIGRRLGVTEQTVKFHLRHIFIKFGVKRRAELISRLLM
jgi:DNA-binding CsgD family transcriptional regulator